MVLRGGVSLGQNEVLLYGVGLNWGTPIALNLPGLHFPA